MFCFIVRVEAEPFSLVAMDFKQSKSSSNMKVMQKEPQGRGAGPGPAGGPREDASHHGGVAAADELSDLVEDAFTADAFVQ